MTMSHGSAQPTTSAEHNEAHDKATAPRTSTRRRLGHLNAWDLSTSFVWHGLSQRETPVLLRNHVSTRSLLGNDSFLPWQGHSVSRILGLKEWIGRERTVSGACWTKISNTVVDRATLERLQERFGEANDHYVVLRVLKKSEVMLLALLTQMAKGLSVNLTPRSSLLALRAVNMS
jgi:hypothetical protein